MITENSIENESPGIRGPLLIRVIFISAVISVEYQQSALQQHPKRPLGKPTWPL